MSNKLLALLLICLPALGYAEQRLVVRPGGNVTAHIASTSLNRIAVQGDRIASIKGSAGQFQLEKDLNLGQIFIQPNSPEDKTPIHIYLTTEQGNTYSMTLLSADMPAENITLVSTSNQNKLANWDITAPYETVMVNIIKAMHHQAELEGFSLSPATKNNYKIEGLLVTHQDSYLGDKLQGERYQIENVSEDEILLKNADFYKHDVRAISILTKKLPPQGKTSLYIVRGI